MTKAEKANLKKTRVLIVEDSLPVQTILKKVYARIPNVEIVATVASVDEATQMVHELKPNFISLDMKLIGGSGIDFLKKSNFREYSRKTGARCVLVTDYGLRDGNYIFDAISQGASAYIRKPQGADLAQFTTEMTDLIAEFFRKSEPGQKPIKLQDETAAPIDLNLYKLIAIGSSTGGTEVVRDIVAGLPKHCPPVVIAQHMPEQFTPLYAQRIEAQTGRVTTEIAGPIHLLNDHAYVAPGAKNTAIEIHGPHLCAASHFATAEYRFKPSVSVLFGSILKAGIANKTIAIMLTGMGHDGAKEMKALKDAGAVTIGQSKESCVVYGMPRAAAEMGALCMSADPEGIIKYLNKIAIAKKAG